ncbi:hypothetical protein niasHT_038590 [Heterodera trifolii]|uniref:G-protein coupled receptors family 1 profile domain-containing protein n=1 Tax=Heterodera trifolii TaxID=157864 RepID=A0ABD2I358_9BILA
MALGPRKLIKDGDNKSSQRQRSHQFEIPEIPTKNSENFGESEANKQRLKSVQMKVGVPNEKAMKCIWKRKNLGQIQLGTTEKLGRGKVSPTTSSSANGRLDLCDRRPDSRSQPPFHRGETDVKFGPRIFYRGGKCRKEPDRGVLGDGRRHKLNSPTTSRMPNEHERQGTPFLGGSFRGTVNYFLALCCFFELIHQPAHFLFVYTAFSGQNFIEYRLAVKITFIPWFGIAEVFPMMFFTGIDRLIAIVFAEMHNKCKIRLYLTTVTVICILLGFDLLITLYQLMNLYGDQMITGCITDFIKSPSRQNITLFCFTIMTIVVYLFLGVLIKIKSSGLPSADQINRGTFRALFCIIAVNVGGYFISSFYTNLIESSISSPITAWFGQVIAGIPLNIGAAANGPILYLTSTDYRQAFQTQFPFVFKRISNQNQVAPLQQNGRPMQLITTNAHLVAVVA